VSVLRNARTRLILASVLLSSTVTALVLWLVHATAMSIITDEMHSVVEAEIAGLSDDYNTLGLVGLARAIERRMDDATERDAIYLLADRQGVAITGNLGAWPPTVETGGGWVEMELIRTDRDQSVPVAAASLRLPGGERLLVGRDASGRQRFERVLLQSAVSALIAALVLSVITGWLLTRLVFSRMAEISTTAHTIVSGELDQRIPLRGSGDEFDRLATTLNDMLDRIGELVGNLRLTTNSLAHDLRGSLMRLRTQVTILADPDTPEDERDRVAARAADEADQLLRVFSNLTEIARVEARLGREEFEPVDAAALACELAEFYGPIGQERGVAITATGTSEPVPAHRALLTQALSNLLENALRYAPEGSAIDIVTRDDAGRVVLSVTDQGPGVPDEFLTQATRPFVTLDPARQEKNSGLGLTLVAAVARLHNGEVVLENRHPGLSVRLSLSRDRAGVALTRPAR
jgi:signal transduction histidine kinase